MNIENRWLALALRVVLLVCCGYGLYLNTGLSDGRLSFETFNYFTILSNALVLVVFAVLAVRTAVSLRRRGWRGSTDLTPVITGMVLVAITITGIVYNFILVPRDIAEGTYEGGSIAQTMVHTVTPMLVVFDWLLFTRKRSFAWWHPFAWLLPPLLYAIFAFIRAEVGPVLVSVNSRYPYFFLDIDEFGYGAVLINFVGLLIAFLVIGYAYLLLDRLLGIRQRRPA